MTKKGPANSMKMMGRYVNINAVMVLEDGGVRTLEGSGLEDIVIAVIIVDTVVGTIGKN